MSTQLTIADTVYSVEKEEWREHPRVKKILCSSLGKIINRHTLKEYRGTPNEDGYLRTTIREDNIIFPVSFHRFIAESHIGISSLQVNHINGIKTDNRVENLEYVTALQNIRHAIKTGLRKNRSTNVHNSKFDEFRVLTAATYHNARFGQDLIAQYMNVSRGVIRLLVTGFTYGEFSELFTKLPKDTHAKYTARAIKEGKWVITSITEQK